MRHSLTHPTPLAPVTLLSLAALAPLAACGGNGAPPPRSPEPATTVAPPPLASATPAASTPRPAARADTSLPPRRAFFANPDRAAVRLSPDGKRISFLAPVDGVLNVWVGPADDPGAAKPVTADKKRGIRRYEWAYTNDHVLYLQDVGGDEDWHVYAVDLKTTTTKDLTPMEKVHAQIEARSHKIPREVVIGLNDRDPKHHDLYRVDVVTGARKLLQKNEEFAGFAVDDDFGVRLAQKSLPDGGTELLQPVAKNAKAAPASAKKGAPPASPWKSFVKTSLEDSLTTEPVDFDKKGAHVLMKDSRGRDTAALVEVDLATGASTPVAEDAKADIGDVVIHPTEKRVEAVVVNYDRARWKVIDKSVAPDFAYLGSLPEAKDAEMLVPSRSLDEKRWIVAFVPSDGPVRFFRYDRDPKKATFLFTNSKALEKLPLAKMQPVVIRSRDGLDLVSYLTLPRPTDADAHRGEPAPPGPMVLFVHGGPWARDQYGLNPYHQWLASRGYAVLSVNYRGSTGFGKKFVNAGNREWAGKMHEDLVDAVEWAVKEKIADRGRVAIMGGSYGGYATLVGLTFTPDLFACGVDIVGPSNLVTLLTTIPPYWAPMIEQFTQRVGDHRTDDGKKLLTERSPLTRVEKIKRPLLIGQGANDPRVKQAEADQIVKAMHHKGLPVTYVLYPDEGHGFARPENRMSFNAVAEPFLASCLGGRYEPVGDDFKGSSITIPAGKENVAGVGEAFGGK